MGVPLASVASQSFSVSSHHWPVVQLASAVQPTLVMIGGPRMGCSVDDAIWYCPSVIVAPLAAVTFTVTVMVPAAPAASMPVKVHWMVPVAPTAGVVHVAPAGGVNDAKVVPGGVFMSMTTPLSAAPDPFV
jgi:hypothetical protein